MDVASVRRNDTADPVAAKVMRRFAARRAQVEREQVAARIIKRANVALRDQYLTQLGGLLDALRREPAA